MNGREIPALFPRDWEKSIATCAGKQNRPTDELQSKFKFKFEFTNNGVIATTILRFRHDGNVFMEDKKERINKAERGKNQNLKEWTHRR